MRVLHCAGHLSRRGAWPRPLGQIIQQSQGPFPETCPQDGLSSRAKMYLDGKYSLNMKPEVIICQGIALCRASVQKRRLAQAPRTDHPAESGSSPTGVVRHVLCAHVGVSEQVPFAGVAFLPPSFFELFSFFAWLCLVHPRPLRIYII